MKKIQVFNQEVTLSVFGISIYLIVMILLCSLGVWQLNRAEQKRVYVLAQQQAMAQTDVLDLNQTLTVDLSVVKFQKVHIVGHFDQEHQFLLDNRIQDGKPGYWVFTPFFPDDRKQQAVLVNRGWLPVGNDRRQLPDVHINVLQTALSGRINQFPGLGIKLTGAEIPTDGWPATVQLLDSSVLSARLGYQLVDYQIELDPDSAEGYTRQWQLSMTTLIPPEKHIAYAVQWFALALMTTGWFFWQCTRKQK